MAQKIDINRLKGKLPGKENGIEIRKTICSICNPLSNCGIDAYVKDGMVIKVEGTKENPHSAGTLCSKGAASRQYIYNKDRLRTPLIRKGPKGSGRFEPISWERSFEIITEKLQKIKEEAGPESVVFYVGYPKWQRPYVKRLAHSFGSPNYCTESSVCYQAAVIGAKLNYGYFGPPEIAKSRCLLIWSSNPFYSNTTMARKIVEAKERGVKVIEVGPLISPVTSHADIHLRIRPGTDGALALGMANVIIEEELYDREFIENWTLGFDEYCTYVQEFNPKKTEKITGVEAELIIKAARLYATTKPAALLTGASPTVHHTNGVQNHRAITLLVGLTGNFDQEGGNYVIPPNYLYVPNGLSFREAEFSQSRPYSEMKPRIGADIYPIWCKLVSEAQSMHIPFQIRSRHPYPIKAIVAFGLNYRMWPGSDFMKEALEMLDLFVDVDIFMTDSARLADLILPACTSFERSELKTYPESFVIWTSPVIKPIGESRSDLDIITELAKRLTPEDQLLTRGYEVCANWIMEPSGLTVEELKRHPSGFFPENIKMPPYKKYEKAGFPTPSGKMEFTSNVLREAGFDPLPEYKEPKLSPISTPELAKDFPLVLTTGARLPNFIHSQTFRLGWMKGLSPDPFIDINPLDAEKRGISPGDMVVLSTPRGSTSVKANITEKVPLGVVNIYHGYPEVDLNRLIDPEYLDPISGFPGFKSLLCEVKKVNEGKEEQ